MFRYTRLLFAGAAMLATPLAFAINGLNLTGYGLESSALGGPDAPLSRDTFGVTLNPAGLAQIKSQRVDIYATGFGSPGNFHTDARNGTKPVDKDLYFGAYGGLGYARRLADSKVTVGGALVVQGGNGTGYKHLETRFNTSDEFSGVFGVSKLALGAGWEVTDRLRLGASAGISYSTATQSVFPDTSVLNTFYGMRVKDLAGFSSSVKLGLQYQLADNAVFGLNYGSPTKLRLKGGSARVNYSADPAIGTVVRYDDVELKGLELPTEWAAGIVFRPVQSTMVAVQYKFYEYSKSLKSTTMTAGPPRDSAAPAFGSQVSPINARDQGVLTIGVAYDYDRDTILRAGINYCNRIIPDQNIGPTFAIIQTRHWSTGIERKLDADWSAGGVFEFYPKKTVTYTTPGGLFGPNAKESNGGYVVTLGVSRHW